MVRALIAIAVLSRSAVAQPCPTDKRHADLRADEVVALIEPALGRTVVDLGAGHGLFLCRLSHAVGPYGRVIATEVTANLVGILGVRAKLDQLTNIAIVAAPLDDVGVGPAIADVVFVHHVWHHLANRTQYASRIARALAPGGTVLVVDFLPDGGHGIKPERVIAELAAGGIDAEVVQWFERRYAITGSVRWPPRTCGPHLPPRLHCTVD